LSACSPAAATLTVDVSTPYSGEGGMPPTPYQEMAAAEATMTPAGTQAPYPTAPATPSEAGGETSSTSPLAYSPSGSGMVIKDAAISLLVENATQALNQLNGLVGQEGGYIINSQTWYQDGYLYASLRMGIPSARFEEALNQVRRIGLQILGENAQGQDVSNQYVDLQSRLTNLEATAARVRDFLKNAKTIEDSLRISQQLSELEGQIEQVKGQMRYFEGRSAFSTLTVNLTPRYPTPTPTATPTGTPTPTATPQWNPGATLNKAGGVFTRQFQGFVDGAIWFVVILGPWLALAGLIYLALRRALRKAMLKGK
jgi:hypothetical protein